MLFSKTFHKLKMTYCTAQKLHGNEFYGLPLIILDEKLMEF